MRSATVKSIDAERLRYAWRVTERCPRCREMMANGSGWIIIVSSIAVDTTVGTAFGP